MRKGWEVTDIDDRTKISLFAVAAAVPVLVTTVVFVAMAYFKADAAEARIDLQAIAIKEQRDMIMEIRDRTARIENMLENLQKGAK
jgi:hypothetical protein